MSAAVTPRERWLAGIPAQGRDERDRYAEYAACASDADRAYVRQVAILNGLSADAVEEALLAASEVLAS